MSGTPLCRARAGFTMRGALGRLTYRAPGLGGPACLLAAVLAALPLLTAPLTGWAQIEEIVVTARKREEVLTDVPISVEAFTGEELERKGLNDIADIAAQSASVKFDVGTARSDTRLSIRGISPTRGRQNAAILVDGIDVSSEAVTSSGGSILLSQRLLSLQRVEIVKGPQIALWGRSAFNGALNWVTKDPPSEFHGEVSADGSYGDAGGASDTEAQTSLKGEIGGPILDEKLGLMLTGGWWDENGFYDNSITGTDLGGEQGYGFALKSKSDFGNGLVLRARAEFSHYEYQPSAEGFLGFNPPLPRQPRSALQENPDVPSTAYPGGGTPALFCLPNLLPPNDPNNPNEVVDRLLNQALIDQYTELSRDPSRPALGDGPHCQEVITVARGPLPDGDQLKPRLATNPFTKQDYEGIDGDTIRLSLIGEWELEKGGFTSWTGYTHDDNTESQDSGKYALADPTSPFRNVNVNLFHNDNERLTRQFQQELRYATKFDGPLNVTLGGTYWEEDVSNGLQSLTMQASGSYCFYSSANPGNADALGNSFFSGAPPCPGYTSLPVAPFVGGGEFTFGDGSPYPGVSPYLRNVPIDRNTDHRSFYGMLEIATGETTKLTLEGRYSKEDLEIVGPFFLNPFASGGPGSWSVCGAPGRVCDETFLFHAPGTLSPQGGPFWSLERFQQTYDTWRPYAPVATGFTIQQIDAIPEVCRADPAVQARIAAVDSTGQDPNFDFFNPFCVGTFERSDEWFSPKVTLDWKPNDDSLLYAYWARAEKPGGFALFTIGASGMRRDLAEYEPEKLNTYEIGGNTTVLDNTLLLSGAVYYYDYTDKQVLVNALAFDGRPVSRIDNAPAELWGGELTATWRPLAAFLGGEWALSGSYMYTDGEYGDFIESTSSENKIALNGACKPSTQTTTVNTGTGPVDVIRAACEINWSGRKFERAPEHSVVGSVTYTRPLTASTEIWTGLDAQWRDDQFVEFENETFLEDYTNVNFQLGLRSTRWEVIGYVNNLLDDDAIRSASSNVGLSCCFVLGVSTDLRPGGFGSVGSTAEVPTPKAAYLTPPRVLGLRATYKFGALPD